MKHVFVLLDFFLLLLFLWKLFVASNIHNLRFGNSQILYTIQPNGDVRPTATATARSNFNRHLMYCRIKFYDYGLHTFSFGSNKFAWIFIATIRLRWMNEWMDGKQSTDICLKPHKPFSRCNIFRCVELNLFWRFVIMSANESLTLKDSFCMLVHFFFWFFMPKVESFKGRFIWTWLKLIWFNFALKIIQMCALKLVWILIDAT